MATQYDPILKDSTGQAIVTKLEGIKNAINPTAENIPITTIEGMEAENVQEGLEELKQSLVNKITFDTETTSQMYQAITTSGGSLVSLTSTATATLTSNGASGVSVGYFKKASSGHVGFSIVNYASVRTWTGRIVSDGTVEYLSSLASTTDLDNMGTWVQLLVTDSAFSTTAKSFALNKDFTQYKSLVIHYCQYQNILDCKIVSSSYFNTTSSGTRPIFADWNSNHGVSVYKNTTTSVYVTAKSSLDAQYNVKIYGIK